MCVGGEATPPNKRGCSYNISTTIILYLHTNDLHNVKHKKRFFYTDIQYAQKKKKTHHPKKEKRPSVPHSERIK